MEKMKMGVGTMAALMFVAVAVSALLISFGIAQATQDKVKVSFELDIQQTGNDVTVVVKAKGLEPNADFQVRAYTSATDCGGPPAKLIGTEESNSNGNLVISGKISPGDIGDVNSVSIRNAGPPNLNPPVVCFHDTTP